MIIVATAQQGGEPVACAYGCVLEGRGLRAGMLFVRAGLTSLATEFEHPFTKNRIVLLLPPKALGLAADGRAYNAFLDVPETP